MGGGGCSTRMGAGSMGAAEQTWQSAGKGSKRGDKICLGIQNYSG